MVRINFRFACATPTIIEIFAHQSIEELRVGIIAAFSYYFGIGKGFCKKAEMRFYFWMPLDNMAMSLVRQFYFSDAAREKLFHACRRHRSSYIVV